MESLIVSSTPYILIGMAVIFVGAIYLIEKAPTTVLGEVMMDVMWISAVMYIVAVFVASVSMMIHPWERFTDMAVDPVVQLLTDIGTAEKDVCTLITRTDNFIKNDMGKPGHDNPQLVTDAQQKARAAVGGPLTDCDASWPVDISGEAALQEADNRLTRMEATLKSFTGPELQATYNKTVPCQAEGFQGQPTNQLRALQARLTVVQGTIRDQQQKLLKPVDDKTAALQRGEVSDCDKKRGANVAVVAKAPK